jgi:hypothetical protein
MKDFERDPARALGAAFWGRVSRLGQGAFRPVTGRPRPESHEDGERNDHVCR